MLLKHWKGVVLTRAMSSAGRNFMQALKKPLIQGGFLPLEVLPCISNLS